MTFSVPGYRTIQLLGAGGQGEVFLAEELDSGERVALKRIRADDPDAVRRARDEAALLSALDHPHLITLRSFVVAEDSLVLVLEVAEGGTLAALLHRRQRLTPPEVVAAISPLAGALAYAHATGVLHGDVSPSNILFTATGQPKLADLGVARLFAATAEELGTPAYLDPTIAAGGAAGPQSDVFSLAAVAVHALTGAGPWTAPGAPVPSAEQVLRTAATGRLMGVAERLAAYPPELARTLLRALESEPCRRGTAAELALDLRASVPPGPVVLSGGRIPARGGRHAAEARARPAVGDVPVGDVPVRLDSAGATSARTGNGTGLSFVPADLTAVSRPRVRASLAEPFVVAEQAAVAEPAAVAERDRRRRSGSARFGLLFPSDLPRLVRFPRRLLIAVLVGMLVTAGVIGWPALRQRQPVAAAPAVSPPLPEGSSVSGGTPGPAIVPASPGSTGAVAQPDPVRALTELDALRARAFAERRPELLGRVYASNRLLAADQAELGSLVPAGCRLSGLHTTYRQLRTVARSGRTVRVRVSASLAAAELLCDGAIRGHTPAFGPVSLELVLSDDGSGPRISSQPTV